MIVYRIGTRFNAKTESKVAYAYEQEYYKYISQLSPVIIPNAFRLGILKEVE